MMESDINEEILMDIKCLRDKLHRELGQLQNGRKEFYTLEYDGSLIMSHQLGEYDGKIKKLKTITQSMDEILHSVTPF